VSDPIAARNSSTLPVQIDGAGRRGFQQRQTRPKVVRCGARGQARPVVDLAMRQTPDAPVGKDVDRGVEDPRAAFGVGRHQSL